MPDNTQQRRELLRQIEEARHSRVIAYITGDRRGAETRIGMDVFPWFYEVLNRIGHVNQIDLLLYSTGGLTMAAWGLANLLREFCNKLCVLVPFKAHSAATLLALGANEIVMGPMGQLSPVDPSVTGPFNPTGSPNPGQPNIRQPLPLSVEDVLGYFDLARKEAGIDDHNLIEVFKKLCDTVQPMALGSVYRAKQQIRLLAEKMLALHMNEQRDKARIETISKQLTKELYSHDYLISRREAKRKLRMKIVEASAPLKDQIWDAFNAYATAIEMNTPYNPAIILGGDAERVVDIDGSFIESAEKGFVFRTSKRVQRIAAGTIPGLPPGAVGYQEEVIQQGWIPIQTNVLPAPATTEP